MESISMVFPGNFLHTGDQKKGKKWEISIFKFWKKSPNFQNHKIENRKTETSEKLFFFCFQFFSFKKLKTRICL
jgi:hypothetical protein